MTVAYFMLMEVLRGCNLHSLSDISEFSCLTSDFLLSLQCNHFARVEFETLLAPSPALFWGKMSEITLNVFCAEVN